jgi:hypothetical protein
MAFLTVQPYVFNAFVFHNHDLLDQKFFETCGICYAFQTMRVRLRHTYKTQRSNGCFFKFGVEVGVELSIVNALYRLRITDQLVKSYTFTRVVRSQSTLQRLLRRQI